MCFAIFSWSHIPNQKEIGENGTKKLEIRKKTGEKVVIMLGVRPLPQATLSQVTGFLGDDWESIHVSLANTEEKAPNLAAVPAAGTAI